jgi:hypothetical protein
MTGRALRTSAGIAGTIAAATAGALTVGLIAGVVHTAQTPAATGTSGTGISSTGTSGTGSAATNNSSAGLGSVSQNAAPVGGSHGS